MKKRMLSLLLCTVLLFGVLSGSAYAADVLIAEWSIEGNSTVHRIYASGTSNSAALSAFESGWNSAMEAADANHQKMMTFKLYRDWIGDGDLATYYFSSGAGFNWWAIYIQDGAKVTLDLNGYMINRNRDSSPANGNGEVIYVDDGATLIITDSNPLSVHKGSINSEGLWRPASDGAVNIYGGIITGGYSRNGAGGIHVKANAKVVLSGGAVVGNKSDENIGGGGGVELESDGSLLQMYDGASILYNVAGDNDGGGVEIYNGSFEMYGGLIAYNRANDYGGGVDTYEDDNTAFVMTGGVICNNKATYGGGVYIDSSVLIDGGQITDNEATLDGGGIYFNDDDGPIIKSAEVRNNTADRNGGGIYVNTDGVEVHNVSISGNSAQNGGGIYAENDDFMLSACNISGNTAEDYGGGVYLCGEDSAIAEVAMIDNDAGEHGSGLYIGATEGHVISDLTLTDNAGTSGIYQSRGSIVCYKGTCLIGSRDAASLSLSEGAYLDAEGLASDSAIWLMAPSYEHTLSSVRGSHNAKGIYAVMDNFGIAWVNDPYDSNYRHLRYVSAEAAESPVETETVPNGILETTQYQTAEHTYRLLKGTYSYCSCADSLDDSNAIFYYSDGYFEDTPDVYNTHLATMSMNLAMSGFYSNIGKDGTTYVRDGQTMAYPQEGDYTNKHANVRQLLSDIGVSDDDIFVNDWYIKKPTPDTIGVAIGQKALAYEDGTETGNILLPIIIRSANYELEWVSNVTVGDGSINNGEAYGFSTAADKAMGFVREYISHYGLTNSVESGKVKFWVVGYSRGGATANLLSKRLTDEYCNTNNYGIIGVQNEVYGYCFEAPQGGTDKNVVSADYTYQGEYRNIHNCINVCDIVPMVAPSQMGFHRYGVDHYVPGTANNGDYHAISYSTTRDSAYSRVDGDNCTWVTTYSDNEAYFVKPVATYIDNHNDAELERYYAQRALAERQLCAVSPDLLLDDYFYTANLNYLSAIFYGFIEPAGDVNDIPRMDQWMDDFVDDLISSALHSRTYYATQAVTVQTDHDTVLGGETFEQAIQTAMSIVFGLSSERMNALMDCFSSPLDALSFSTAHDLLTLWDDALGDWDDIDEDERAEHIEELWDDLMLFNIADVLSEEELNALHDSWPTLIDVLLRFVSYDYAGKRVHGVDETQAHLGTLIYNISRIGANHYPEINLAWLRTYDSFYTTEIPGDEAGVTTQVINQRETECDSPAAYIGDTKLISGASAQEFQNAQKLTLKTDANGDAIYYTLSVNGEPADTVQIYRDGIILEPRDNAEGAVTSYTVSAYAMQYGVMSVENIYYIDIVTAVPSFRFVSRSLTLGGELGLNFYTEILHPELMNDAYLEMTVSGRGGETFRIPLSESTVDSDGYYVFTCPLNVLQMNQEVTATFCCNGSVAGQRITSAAEYLTDVAEHNHEDEKLVTLAHAVANYGYYSQLALQQAHGFTVGTDASCDYQTMLHFGAAPNTVIDLSAFACEVSGGIDEISRLSGTLALDNKTALFIDFVCEDGYTTNVSVTDESNEEAAFNITALTDGAYRVSIPRIAAHELGNEYTVHFYADGTECMTVKLSALSYANAILCSQTATPELKNAVAALFEFYSATMAYLEE